MAINVPLSAQLQNATQLQQQVQNAVNAVRINLGGPNGARALSSLSQPLGRLTGQADEFSKSLDAANARVLAFGASVGVVNAVANAFKSLVNSTIEVEKAITAISVVGDQFNGKTKELSQGLFNIAKNTGQSFAEVSKAALEFARQGQGVEETLKRTNDALILTRSTGLDAAKSVEGISAAVSAFAKAGLTTAQVINKLAAVDKAFKVSSADLIQAFERTGAVAQQAGVSFDELAGIVTALQNDTSRGGAVIGNALKTIFSRLQDTSTLTQLQDLGIAVQDLQGNLLPARQILQNLAGDVQGLSKVTQAGIFKDVAGTFQLNQLVSLVNDLNKAKSVSATATEISTGATNEAYVANEKLNQSLDALLNKVAITGKQLGSILGEIGLTDNLKGLLDGVNSFLEDVNGVLQGDDIGSNFAKGFVKGIGAVLSGPGLGIFLAIIAKLSYDLLRFGTESLKTFFGIGKAASDQKQIQESIVQTLLKNQNVLNSILSAQGGQNAQGLKFLGILNQQAAAMQSIQGLAGNIAGTVYSAGYRQTDRGLAKKAAGGYLPAQEASDVRRGVGGASPSSKVVSIPNFAFGGGKRGTMVANTSEYIVPNYAGGGSAIFNQDMVKTMGLPAGAKKISAAGGFIPNFADEDVFNDYALIVNKPFGTKREKIKSGRLDEEGKPIFYNADIYGINPANFKKGNSEIYSKRFSAEKLEERYKTLAIKDAKNFSEKAIGQPISPVSIQNLANAGSVPSLAGTIFETAIQSVLNDDELIKRLSESQNAPFDFVRLPKINELFNVPTTVPYLEAKSTDSPDARKSFAKKIDDIKTGRRIIEDTSSYSPGLKQKIIAYKNRSEYKSDAAKGAFGEIASGMGLDRIRDRDKINKKINRIFGSYSSANGYIPNFAAAALQQAIAREKSAGLSNSQIYVDQNSSLKSPLNPMGLMVANTRDEPFGGIQGISRARNEGANPKTYGAANGFVPNYAASGSAKQFDDELKKLVEAVKKGSKTQDEANKELQTFVRTLKTTKGTTIAPSTQNKYLKRGGEDIASAKDSEKVNKGFGDLAGKLIVAQTAMSFFSGSVEGATDTTSKWINALSQTIGSLVQFGFLLSTTGLGGKIGKTLQGLGKGIGLDRVAKAGRGLIGGLGSGAATAAGPVGLAVASAYLVNTIGESIKGVFKKDLSVTFDKLGASAQEAASSLTDLNKQSLNTANKGFNERTWTEWGREILSVGLADQVSFAGKTYSSSERNSMSEDEIRKTIEMVNTGFAAQGVNAEAIPGKTEAFIRDNLSKGGARNIDLSTQERVESLNYFLKESAAIGENTKKRKELQDAQKLAVIQDTQYNDRITNSKNAISALNAQLKSLRDLVQSVEIGAMFEKFNNKSVVDLNNGLSSAARGVREFENSIKEIKIDTETEKFKKLSEALIDINKKVQVKAVDFGSDVGGAALDAVAKIQEAIQGGNFEKLRATFTANAQQLGGVFTSKEVEDLSRSLQEQLDDLDRQRVIKEQQQRLDFVSKNLNEQNSLILEKQNSVLEKRLGLIEKEFEFKKKTNDIDRQISDAKFETGLIGKSRTEQLTSQRGRVAETQKRANEDVIRELQQQLVDSIKAIEIPTTLSPEAQQNLKAQRNATVSGVLQQPAGANPQEQIKFLTDYAGNMGQGILANIAEQEKQSSNYAFDQTIEAANGFANIILASAVDLSSSLNNAMNALKVPNLQEELNKAKSNVQKQTELSSALGRATGNKNKSQGLIDAENKVKEITDKINAITQQGSSTSQAQATKKAQAEVNARVEKMRADQAAAATAAAAIKAEEQKNAITQDGIVASKKLVLDAALAKKAAKEFNQSLLELGDSFTNLKNLVRDYIEGLPASLANLQFGALQSTSANDLSSNLIRQQVIKDSEALNPAGVSGSFEDQKKQTEFVAAQTAWREKSFELATAEGAVRRFELEFELKYLEKFLKLKEEGASVEKLAALEREKNAEKRTFGYGFDKGLSTVEERIDNYRTTLGEEIPNLFSSNLAQGLNDAISGAKDLKTALTDAATAFFQEITRKNISNLADMATKGLGSLAETGFSALKSAFPGGVTTKASGGFIKGGSGTKDDVPAMLMGGEYVVKKSAVSKYGKGFLDAINSGNMRGYATGGMVDPQTFPTQTGSGGFFTPGDYGQGAITGKNELLTFASQSFTGGQYDYMGGFGMGGATVSLEPESARLSALGREGSPMFERVQQSKDEAFRVYLEGLQKEKEYSALLDQIAKDKKARKKQLQMSIISAVASSALNAVGSVGMTGAKNAVAAASKAADIGGKTLGAGAKFMAGAKGFFTGSGGQGGLANIFKGTGTQLSDLVIANQNAKIMQALQGSVQGQAKTKSLANTQEQAVISKKLAEMYSNINVGTQGIARATAYGNKDIDLGTAAEIKSGKIKDAWQYLGNTGAKLQPGKSIASNVFKTGTILKIGKKEYIVQDIGGMGPNIIDFYAGSNKKQYQEFANMGDAPFTIQSGGLKSQKALNKLFGGDMNSFRKFQNMFGVSRAAGGLISGGSNVRDDVPAMLTGGEFVLNNRATQRLGVQNLNKLNSGSSISSEGAAPSEVTQALMSKLDELIEATQGSSQSSVVVNVSSTDQQEENPADMNERDKELQKKIRQAVLDVIAQEKRLGGSLEKSR